MRIRECVCMRECVNVCLGLIMLRVFLQVSSAYMSYVPSTKCESCSLHKVTDLFGHFGTWYHPNFILFSLRPNSPDYFWIRADVSVMLVSYASFFGWFLRIQTTRCILNIWLCPSYIYKQCSYWNFARIIIFLITSISAHPTICLICLGFFWVHWERSWLRAVYTMRIDFTAQDWHSHWVIDHLETW